MTERTKQVDPKDADLDATQRQSRALAEATAAAEENQSDETVPGGRYVVNGRVVNAEGEPIKEAKKDE